ncbi:MAG: arginine--tRNA ligase [Peptococcaceae bacterium]|nr:arginine--tRNA ligase [Peptococcaceae bacterium]
MSIYITLKETIQQEVTAALERAREKGSLAFKEMPSFILEKPREAQHGDLATNAAMVLAKEARKAPRVIADILLEELRNLHEMSAEGTWIEQTEIAGPGFVNFRLKKDWLFEVAPEILQEGDCYGSVDVGHGEKVLVEFVSANPTGLPHMGNARGAALGDSLATLLHMAGYEVDREFYINDAGNQIEKLADSLEARYFQAVGRDVEFPEDGYQGQDLIDKVTEMVADVGDTYVTWEAAARRSALTERVLELNIADMRETLKGFGVEFDRWFSEKSLHESGKIQETLDVLAEKGCLYEKEGALWLKSTAWGDEKDEVVVRANGIPTYFAADIAYHADKFARGYTQLVDVWGADHHGHVARMKGAMQALGYDAEQLKIILMQLVFLLENDDIQKMSKRLGQYVTLQELLNEVGSDVARLFFVMRAPDSMVEFDLELAKKELNINPVWYVQYACARTASILRNAKERFEDVPAGDAQWELLVGSKETALIQKLAELPLEVSVAARLMEPHHLAYYALDLASLYHTFDEEHRVLVQEEGLRRARLGLVQATRQVLVNVLRVLGVSAPERM